MDEAVVLLPGQIPEQGLPVVLRGMGKGRQAVPIMGRASIIGGGMGTRSEAHPWGMET
uniref:Uncharacterized protein n=1 Tax=Candidatus Kentrum eta TaxID=2126337 RepID=A0A450UMF8_9GAMM|nr:MAG: hypothetical protein BECKH772A_GA0070896_100511 [Candidatus Kentron sp. H]VFJ93711.1 MAG: hypothetical protein BECKH772B_GA0070898_100491 [Candidatus Kentron sp. H]VFK00537.1 MAG: hypothetical protein BECKH772C_GA0070978_100481 [Candidatus Kentron sp. H]